MQITDTMKLLNYSANVNIKNYGSDTALNYA